MMITKLTGINIKGATFEHEVMPITIFAGPNGSGKTARLHALALALYGRLPDRRTNPAIFELASGPEMGTTVEFSNGARFSRIWRKSGKSIKGTTVGDIDHEWPAIMIDAGEYFGKSPAARTELIFNTLGSNVVVHGHERTTQDLRELISDLLKVQPITFKGDPETPIEFLATAIAAIEELRKATKQDADRMTKTLLGMADLRTRYESEKHDSGAYAAQLEKLRKNRDATMEQRGRLIAALGTAKAHDAMVEGIRRRIEQEKRKLEAPAPAQGHDPEAIRKVLAALPQTGRDLDMTRAELAGVRAQREAMRRELEALVEAIKRTEGMVTGENPEDCCALCGAKREHWRDTDEIVKLLKGEQARKERLEADLIEVGEKLEILTDFVQVEKQREELQGELRIAELQHKTRELWEQARKASEEDLKQFETGLAQLESEDVSDPETLEHQQYNIDCEIDDLDAAIADTEAKIRQQERYRQDLQRLAQAEQEAERLELRLAELKEAEKTVKGWREDAIGQAFTPLLKMIEVFTNGIFHNRIELRDLELGRIREGVWCPVGTFSGSEQAIVYAAVSAALTIGEQGRILIVDELTRIDRERRLKFLANVEHAIEEGMIDQFFGADISPILPNHECIISLEEAGK